MVKRWYIYTKNVLVYTVLPKEMKAINEEQKRNLQLN